MNTKTQNRIGIIVGSLRKDSYNRKVAEVLTQLAPPSLAFEFIELGKLTFYNQDLDDTPPADWVKFRNRVKEMDGILFATPEYNRSVPGVLKNAIDIGSRPYGESVWDGKPCAVISVALGATGGFGSNHHLRQSLMYLNMRAMAQPEAYVGGAAKLFDDQGTLANESTKKFLKKFIDSFAAWMSS